MDLKIDELIIEEDRSEHIAKHKVKIEEILEVVGGDYVYLEGKGARWLVIGKTKKKRFLTIVVGKRRTKNTFGLVTARPASRNERNFFKEFTFQVGGKKYD